MDDKIILAKLNSKIAKNPVTINLKRREVNMHYVFEDELKNLGTANIYASVNLTAFGVVFGAAMTLWITALTVSFASQNTANFIIAVAVALSLASLYLAVRCFLDVRRARRQLAAIMETKENAEVVE